MHNHEENWKPKKKERSYLEIKRLHNIYNVEQCSKLLELSRRFSKTMYPHPSSPFPLTQQATQLTLAALSLRSVNLVTLEGLFKRWEDLIETNFLRV